MIGSAPENQEISEVLRRLEAGEPLIEVTRSLGLGAVDLVEAIAREGLGGEESIGLGLTPARPTHPALDRAVAEPALAELFPGSSRPARLALAAGLFQVLDLWDLSHAAAQEADDLGDRTSASYWHLIAHRREPDPGNALYWARRVGRHPIHPALARSARLWLEAQGDHRALAERVAPGGNWSAAGLIDLATTARPGTTEETLARGLQRWEMSCLLQASLAAVQPLGAQDE